MISEISALAYDYFMCQFSCRVCPCVKREIQQPDYTFIVDMKLIFHTGFRESIGKIQQSVGLTKLIDYHST